MKSPTERAYDESVQACDGAWAWMMEAPRDKGRVYAYRDKQHQKHSAWRDVLAERKSLTHSGEPT